MPVVLRRLDLRGTGTDDLRRRLPRPAAQTEPPIDEVRALLAEVREHGDDALRAFAVRFDGVELDDLRVPPADVAAALDEIPRDLRDALEAAHENIAAYHDAQRSDEVVHHNGALEIRELVRPVDRVGCYVPSALAPLVSTALMTLVPAKVAGVPEVVLVSPARPDGKVPAGILAAAALAGVDEVYRIGGPAAIAALAFLAVLLFVVRPATVLLSLAFSRIPLREQLFVGWIAPRGIVGEAPGLYFVGLHFQYALSFK